jgi:hypothetical protein
MNTHTVKNLAINSLFAFTMTTFATAQEVEYNPEKFANPKKMWKSMVEIQAENILTFKVSKIMVEECFSEIQINQALANSDCKSIIAKNTSFDNYMKSTTGLEVSIGGDYYETIMNFVFARLKKMFFENTIELLDVNQLINSPEYQDEKLNRPLPVELFAGNTLGQYPVNTPFKTSVTGMGMFSDTWSKEDSLRLYNVLPKIAYDTKCNAAIRVKIKIGTAANGNAILEKFDIYLDSNSASYKSGKTMLYKYKNLDAKIASLKKPIVGTAMVSTGDAIDMDAYTKELTGILSSVIEMISYGMSGEI